MDILPKLPSYPTNSFTYLQNISEAQFFQPQSDQQVPSRVRVSVIVVGAGVGGLASAIALKAAGHDVTVYESTPALSELGAGIQVPPNSSRILHSWGLETELAKKAVQPDRLEFKRWQNGKVIGRTQYRPHFRECFGYPYYVIHRAHLHEVLHHKAVELGVVIRLASRIKKYHPDEPSIELVDGSVVRADLIVAADGLRSLARRTLNGEAAAKLRSHGVAAYRATVRVEDMMKDPKVAATVQTEALNLWVGNKTHVMSYAIAGGGTWNIVATVPEPKEPNEWDEAESHSVEKLRSFYDGWDPALTEILSLVKHTSKWPIQDILLPDKVVSDSGRLILLGDAGHAMTPLMSLGAAMAVEDACALAESLRFMKSKDDLSEAIRLWESVRTPRVRMAQDASWLHGITLHLPDGPAQRARDEGMAAEVQGRHFVWSPNQWSDPTTQRWAYTYDAALEIRKAWEARGKWTGTERLGEPGIG